MSRSKVRQDRHGLFVITNGSVFRPQHAVLEAYSSRRTGTTRLMAGQAVHVQHVAQSAFAHIKALDDAGTTVLEELWGSHGCRWRDGGTVPSEQLWNPVDPVVTT